MTEITIPKTGVTKTGVTKTGVIGLGAMGLQMARYMAAKGFEVYGADIDEDAVSRASAHGVRPCGSAAAVGERAEIIVVMVATDAQVEDVIRTSGLMDRLRPGAVICISSSSRRKPVATLRRPRQHARS